MARRRMVIIEFPTARAPDGKVIEKFEEKILEEESEGVFTWMIQGGGEPLERVEGG
jgi:hypothetical protein